MQRTNVRTRRKNNEENLQMLVFFTEILGKFMLTVENVENAKSFISRWMITIFCSLLSGIQTEYQNILCQSPYSVRIRENTDQKNSKFGHFSHSDRS